MCLDFDLLLSDWPYMYQMCVLVIRSFAGVKAYGRAISLFDPWYPFLKVRGKTTELCSWIFICFSLIT